MNPDCLQALAFDFGTSRIGVAVGQTLTATATAIAPVSARDGIPDWNQIDQIVQEWSPDALVVGIPLNMDGSISDMARRARKFANRLHERYKLPSFLMDERLSTREAKSIHRAAGGGTNYKKESVDGIAAQLILESWFSSEQRIPSHSRLEDLYDIGQS
ncbi:Holliday junction resolvase RuvX [Marinobacterium rhizophilum]|uniref:Putative pre-16S rRNA nuclease n=1 Tax=Marinobacterium rhizophilum TaxID=420402 RepID=A0ABY5HEK9_9GAMM|nr:Holliday junction resolvase RuvX [Marinobacterium rhizophilum]UTW10554.1 Holliday junction resolvase RuvX [Marinobacterium rhizophilum]